jgi:cysteine synthase
MVKLEWFNPTGSYKDRMALTMVEEAERRGELVAGMTVVECTGGSTGSSLAYVCAAKGHRLQVVTSDVFAEEKLKTIAALGAELIVLPSGGGGITAELVTRMIDRARELLDGPAAEPGCPGGLPGHRRGAPRAARR